MIGDIRNKGEFINEINKAVEEMPNASRIKGMCLKKETIDESGTIFVKKRIFIEWQEVKE